MTEEVTVARFVERVKGAMETAASERDAWEVKVVDDTVRLELVVGGVRRHGARIRGYWWTTQAVKHVEPSIIDHMIETGVRAVTR